MEDGSLAGRTKMLSRVWRTRRSPRWLLRAPSPHAVLRLRRAGGGRLVEAFRMSKILDGVPWIKYPHLSPTNPAAAVTLRCRRDRRRRVCDDGQPPGDVKKSPVDDCPGHPLRFVLAKNNPAIAWLGFLTEGNGAVLLVTRRDDIRFSEQEVRPMGLVRQVSMALIGSAYQGSVAARLIEGREIWRWLPTVKPGVEARSSLCRGVTDWGPVVYT